MKLIFQVLLIILSLQLFAQQPAKKSLSIADFSMWEMVSGTLISNDGVYIAFEQNPQRGDGKLILKKEKDSWQFPRGYQAVFGSENDFVVFQIKQPLDTIRKAKVNDVEKDKMPKDSLGIFVFKHDTVVKFARLKSFKVAEDNAKYVAFLTEPEKAQKDSTQKEKNTKSIKQPSDDLVLFNNINADTTIFKNVTEYTWSKNGKSLFFIQQFKDSVNTFSKLIRFNAEDGNISTVFNSEGFVKSAVSSDEGDKFAFIFSKDTIEEKVYSLYLGKENIEPKEVVTDYTRGIPVGWTPSESGKIWFSEIGLKIYLGTAESPVPEEKDTIPEDEKPVVDVWNWKDLKLQPQQKVEAEKEKERTYLAVYYLDKSRFIQLADVNIKEVSTIEKGDGNIGLGFDDSKYLRSSSWTGNRTRDYYLVDFDSGIKREILVDQSYVRLSPKGKYVVWYNFSDSSYYAKSTDINNLESVSLTKVIPVNFYEEIHDTPNDPRPYGVAGWSEEDRFIFIYDRFDIWKIDPTGEKVPVNVTKTFGRRNKTRLRYVKLDKDLDFIPTNDPILLSAFDERTMSSGFFQTRLNAVKDPILLMMDKYHFGGVTKAKEADKIIWTKESVSVFPDLWCSNLKFEQSKKISEANTWQKEFVWPTVELVEWNSFSGETLKGLLYKPDNFDPAKKYPMLVYFYERSSETMYRYQQPRPSRSTINKALYTSNNYLVFVPDISYKIGYPGQSAYNAIVSGTQFLMNKYSFIDKKKIGLQGQSWGGYQTAYLITQTDLYAAAMAGAPVSNMTSAYGGIRWQTGLSRMFQYEHTQSRIGGTLWEKPLQYIENSPLFYAPKIKTPLLMMHNDNDGAVPWYQGIEFFVALRRLDKPVWLLTYNGEPHNLKSTSWANRIDLSARMFQFFNHYLKGESEPEWMKEGIPATEKGDNLGY